LRVRLASHLRWGCLHSSQTFLDHALSRTAYTATPATSMSRNEAVSIPRVEDSTLLDGIHVAY
jgi:hypothetical protein